MWILTPPWLLFSLRRWRKRCQHDPGSRLWRGSGGKSKTLSISSPHIDVSLSQIFALCFLSRSLSRSERCRRTYDHTDDSFFLLWGSIVCGEETKMTGCFLCLSKSKSLWSARLLYFIHGPHTCVRKHTK